MAANQIKEINLEDMEDIALGGAFFGNRRWW